MASDELKALRRRRDHARADKAVWNGIYEEVWRYAVPFRKPVNSAGGGDRGASRVDHLFDTTAIISTFRGAGRMQQDLFPPGQPFFRLKPGPVTKLVAAAPLGHNGGPPLESEAAEPSPDAEAGEGSLDWFTRQLDNLSDQVQPFFQTGEWDNAISELCIDLFAGTGIMLPVAGDKARPLRFVTLPVDECAIEAGPYGDVSGLFWSTKMSRRAIQAAFPKGRFPKDFLDALAEDKAPDEEVVLNQDFVQAPKGWRLIVSLEDSEEPIVTERYKTQPFVCARYFRVPGESHGRGPAMLAIPTVKTLNRAQELMLKNYALQMLGIWGYRPGGTFNPDMVSKAPGAFWPMQATAGVLGPDVVRLDTGNGRADLSQIVIRELQAQVQAALHDDTLPDGGATPRSATEVMARMARIKQNYVGAFGRMVHEVIPVVIRRAIEILYKAGLVTVDLTIDQLLVSVDVISPLAQALKADAHKTTVEAMTVVAQLEGPQAVARRFKLDEIMPAMIRDLGVDSNLVRIATELADYDHQAQAAQEMAAVAQSAVQDPKGWTEAVNMAMPGAAPGQDPGAAA